MGERVFGLGVGLFLLILVWSLAFLASCFLYRVRPAAAVATFSIVTLFTAILLALPREQFGSNTSTSKLLTEVYDYMFIWRIVLVVAAVLTTLAGLIIYILTDCLEVVRAQPIKKQPAFWKLSSS